MVYIYWPAVYYHLNLDVTQTLLAGGFSAVPDVFLVLTFLLLTLCPSFCAVILIRPSSMQAIPEGAASFFNISVFVLLYCDQDEVSYGGLSEGFFSDFFRFFLIPPPPSLDKFGTSSGKFSGMAFIFVIGLPLVITHAKSDFGCRATFCWILQKKNMLKKILHAFRPIPTIFH